MVTQLCPVSVTDGLLTLFFIYEQAHGVRFHHGPLIQFFNFDPFSQGKFILSLKKIALRLLLSATAGPLAIGKVLDARQFCPVSLRPPGRCVDF